MVNSTRLVESFEELREAWFNTVLKLYPHEREWESVEQESQREEANRGAKAIYDQDTTTLLIGGRAPVAPRCHNDLYKARSSQERLRGETS